MNLPSIQAIAKKELGPLPQEIHKKTIGLCNEVYELVYPSESFILRMNAEQEWLYGTHTFLPLFQQLEIPTPRIVAEDYAKHHFPFCYQLQTKLEGQDLGLVIDELSSEDLTGIAAAVSGIFDKFKTLPPKEDFGGLTGLREEHIPTMLAVVQGQQQGILQANAQTKVIDQETLNILGEVLEANKRYFLDLIPRLYFDDISAKNVMVHEGRFTGLVDLDFLRKGDYLEAIGAMMACWHGEAKGDLYVDEVIRLQKLNGQQQRLVRVYAILHLTLWTSEEGRRFNSNTTATVNWENVAKKKARILDIYQSLL